MAEPEGTALRQQVQQLQQELQAQQQQHSRNVSTTEAVPAGSTVDVTVPAECIPHVASYDTWRVAIKLPPFWVDSPEVWFAQVKAQFSLARITQDWTRYDYVVTHLDALYANETALTCLSLSEEQKIRQLQTAELAERKPSQLLRHMRALAGNMQAILQAQVRLPLNELAEIAYRVIEASLPQLSPTIQAVAAPLNTTELARRIDDIDRQLTSIQQRLAAALTPLRRGNLITTTRVTTTDASGTEPGNVDHPVSWDMRKTPTAAP
ncbi:hypothetical protein HPB49_004117 [Dermacentor silvarum]|uniref:Uncharacterized protein n=1 Tax=Dermacentor silvarum TaxID=543639 RepID=A0ACB8DUN4_DERSI|nr:hypothetical protein HPB49_004117 [Dermacentor silvarum]